MREAEQSARELAADAIRTGRAVPHRYIEVVDENGTPVGAYDIRGIVHPGKR